MSIRTRAATCTLLASFVGLVLVAGCGPAPFPEEKQSYIGSWSASDPSQVYDLLIQADGYVSQYQLSDGVETSLQGGISEWKGDNFVVFFHEFVVAEVPHEVEKDDGAGETFVETHMIVDGVDLVKSGL